MRLGIPLLVLAVGCGDGSDDTGASATGGGGGLGGHTTTATGGSGGAGAQTGGGGAAGVCADGDTRTAPCGQCGTRTEPCVDHAWDSSGPCVGDGGCAPGDTYFTSFDVDEQPISENGVWTHAADPWQKVRTSGGNALAGAYTEIYDDAYAYLGGWSGDDYEIVATVFQGPASAGEAEILLRVSDTGSTVQAYEFLYNTGGSWQFVRWNGQLGDFTVLPSGGSTPSGGNGTQVRATIVGSSIALYWRATAADAWTMLDAFEDTSLPTGKPGMSFYVHQAADNIDSVGFSDWRVTAL